MRQIKFRVWDNENLEFSNYTNRDPFFDVSNGQIFFWERTQKEDGNYGEDIILEDLGNRFIIQQFTGLKDINGVDIYEGDIVEYTQHMFNTDAVRTERKEIKWIEYSAKFNVYETEVGQSGHKVVGNIFEDKNK